MLSLCRQTDGRTDGQSDRRTTIKQYAPDPSIRGQNLENKTMNVSKEWFVNADPDLCFTLSAYDLMEHYWSGVVALWVKASDS